MGYWLSVSREQVYNNVCVIAAFLFYLTSFFLLINRVLGMNLYTFILKLLLRKLCFQIRRHGHYLSLAVTSSSVVPTVLCDSILSSLLLYRALC